MGVSDHQNVEKTTYAAHGGSFTVALTRHAPHEAQSGARNSAFPGEGPFR
jgi:hypothetical protein